MRTISKSSDDNRDGDRKIFEIKIEDNGRGLPQDFSLDSSASLGLDIISTLVQDDLKGSFQLIPQSDEGASAVVIFPKTSVGGVSP